MGSNLRLSINNFKNGDSVMFSATNAFTGKHTTGWDNDFSNGITANLCISTGFYKLTATTYSNGNRMAQDLISWIFFIKR